MEVVQGWKMDVALRLDSNTVHIKGLNVLPWENHLDPLNLSFFTCKMESSL